VCPETPGQLIERLPSDPTADVGLTSPTQASFLSTYGLVPTWKISGSLTSRLYGYMVSKPTPESSGSEPDDGPGDNLF
jgi:hypothetical protein